MLTYKRTDQPYYAAKIRVHQRIAGIDGVQIYPGNAGQDVITRSRGPWHFYALRPLLDSLKHAFHEEISDKERERKAASRR